MARHGNPGFWAREPQHTEWFPAIAVAVGLLLAAAITSAVADEVGDSMSPKSSTGPDLPASQSHTDRTPSPLATTFAGLPTAEQYVLDPKEVQAAPTTTQRPRQPVTPRTTPPAPPLVWDGTFGDGCEEPGNRVRCHPPGMVPTTAPSTSAPTTATTTPTQQPERTEEPEPTTEPTAEPTETAQPTTESEPTETPADPLDEILDDVLEQQS